MGKFSEREGFTFIEVMVAAAILSLGIVMIFKTFFISLNALRYLTHRLYAGALLDNKIVDMQKTFDVKKEIPFQEGTERDTLDINNKSVVFGFIKEIRNMGTHENMYALHYDVSWQESGRTPHLNRDLFIGDYRK